MCITRKQIRHQLDRWDKFRHGLEIVDKLVRLSKLGIKQHGFIIDGVRYVAGDEVDHTKWLSRSIVYTLFLANMHSARLIAGLDNLDVAFHYADAKLIIRSMLERA